MQIRTSGVAAVLAASLTLGASDRLVAQRPPSDWLTYNDPQGRFSFAYPPSFGAASVGMDDGFQERAAAVHLQSINAEAVLTQGAVLVDRQALGGLYDHLGLQLLPDPQRARVVAALPPLTRENFCAMLTAADHVDRRPVPADVLAAARKVDRFGHTDPQVQVCDGTDASIRFSVGSLVDGTAGSPRRFAFGSVRFLGGRYSSFQVVAGGSSTPGASALETFTHVTESFSLR
ncbi:MAG: hypothetical protein ABI051_12890 [Vicinamibacterales bacterium]